MHRTNMVVALVAAVSLTIAAETAVAMPVDQDWYEERGVTEDGRLDIQEVDDRSTDMEVRLSRQVMVLQRQIDVLRRELARVHAEIQGMK